MGKDVGEDSIETRLLTAPDVARILSTGNVGYIALDDFKAIIKHTLGFLDIPCQDGYLKTIDL
jgi:hypothetical protein